MNRQEKAEWLAHFYAKIAEGKQPQCYLISRGWQDSDEGPDLHSDPGKWRIRPGSTKHIDCRKI